MNTEKISLNLNQIKNLIPHREPFLFIDRIDNLILNDNATGIKNLNKEEDFFKGHFPSFPVMPGVLIIEAMAQTAACLVSYSNKHLQGKKVVFLTGVEETKFKNMVLSDNILILKVNLLNYRKNFFKFTGQAIVENQLMATSNFSAMMKE